VISEAQTTAEKIVRYRKDFKLFAREQLKIRNEPFNFWPCQVPLLESVLRQMDEKGFARCIWLKARQIGASTLVQGLIAWRAMLWPHVNALVLADETKRAADLFEISRSFYDHLDEDIRPIGRYHTRKELVFANPNPATRKSDPGLRSRIVIESAHKVNIAIGASWTIAQLSEACRYKDHLFVLDGIIPAVHRVPGTMVILESSAHPLGGWYRDFYEASERGETSFEAKFTPWMLQPEYYICPKCGKSYPSICTSVDHLKVKFDTTADERHLMAEYGLKYGHIRWMREKIGEMNNDLDLFKQSFPLESSDAWITPGIQVYSMEKLREHKKHNIQPHIRQAEIHQGPRILDSPTGKLLIWEEPKIGKKYDIGVDVCNAVSDDEDDGERDASAICVLERGTNKQVAEWISKVVSAIDLATVLYWLGLYYNTAQIAVETNGIGIATNSQLAKLGYSNCYIWRYRDELVARYSKKTGWESSPRSKQYLVGFSTHELLNNNVIIRSELLLRELEVYVQKGYREWGNAPGFHDDRVTAWQIALLISDDENFEKYYGMNSQLKRTVDAYGDLPIKKEPEAWECDREFGKLLSEAETNPWD